MSVDSSPGELFIENRTFAEIEIGECATLSRTLTRADIELFAVMSGDVNPSPARARRRPARATSPQGAPRLVARQHQAETPSTPFPEEEFQQMSDGSTKIAEAEQQVEQMQVVLEHVRRGLEAADRAETAARQAAEQARRAAERATIAAGVILAAVVIGRLTMRRRHK